MHCIFLKGIFTNEWIKKNTSSINSPCRKNRNTNFYIFGPLIWKQEGLQYPKSIPILRSMTRIFALKFGRKRWTGIKVIVQKPLCLQTSGLLCSWSYCRMIYNYLCNHILLMARCTRYNIMWCQWLTTDLWFSPYYVETRTYNSGYTNHRVTCLVVMGSPFDSEQVCWVSFQCLS